MVGLHYVIVSAFDYEALYEFVRSFCDRCEGQSWSDVAAKVGCLGRCEFSDYRSPPLKPRKS